VIRLTSDTSERLDVFLARMLPQFSRSKLAREIGEGRVTVDGAVARSSYKLAAGQVVELREPSQAAAHDLTPAEIPLAVRYEDADLLVVDKPRGLAVHPAPSLKEPSLVNALLGRSHGLSSAGGDFRPGIVHRLDKETTGLLLVAKNDAAHVALARQIEKKTAERRYLAIVVGAVTPDRFTIQAPIGRDKHSRQRMAVDPLGKPATTHVKVLGSAPLGTVVAARLETGRTHQIRVHLSSIGHPIVGDHVYAPKEWREGPMQLHAAYLSFTQPRTGQTIEVYAPPPDSFDAAGDWEQRVKVW
jgi:23S rRNA pseudouridine1911/1915/1917 synthase